MSRLIVLVVALTLLAGTPRIAVDAAGRLVLTELWLGTPRLGGGLINRGHRFAG